MDISFHTRALYFFTLKILTFSGESFIGKSAEQVMGENGFDCPAFIFGGGGGCAVLHQSVSFIKFWSVF